MNTLLRHLSSRYKCAHDAHKDVVNPATLGPRVHVLDHDRSDESVSDGEYKAAQEALQLKRQELEVQIGGEGWHRLE